MHEHACVHACMSTPVYTCMSTPACTHEYVPLCVHIHKHPCVRTHMSTLMCTCAQAFLCVHVHEHACEHMCMNSPVHMCMSTPLYGPGGGVPVVHRKEVTALETPTEHLTSNRTAPDSNSSFSLQGSGAPKTHNLLILLTLSPKPDPSTPIWGSIRCPRQPLPFANFKNLK